MATIEFSPASKLVKEAVDSNKGNMPENFTNGSQATATKASLRQALREDLNAGLQQLDALRVGTHDSCAIDLSLGEYAKDRWGFASDDNGVPMSFYDAIGIDGSRTTIQSLTTMSDIPSGPGFFWIQKEIYREAIRLGYRNGGIYRYLTAATVPVAMPTVNMPAINMSDAMPTKIGEAETVPMGSLSFQNKVVKVQKISIGLNLTDEVIQYVPLNLLGIFLQDVGLNINTALDYYLIDTLINGDGNGNSAPTVGVKTPNTFSYLDMLRVSTRMTTLGRKPDSLLSNEDVSLEVLTLPEFVQTTMLLAGIQAGQKGLNMRTPLPATFDYDVHGAMAPNQLMFIDGSSAIIKLDAQPLRIEEERVGQRGVTAMYATLTTGFANLFTDARVIIDKTLDFATNGFPSYMDIAAYQRKAFKQF
jgi:hypothetical protein